MGRQYASPHMTSRR